MITTCFICCVWTKNQKRNTIWFKSVSHIFTILSKPQECQYVLSVAFDLKIINATDTKSEAYLIGITIRHYNSSDQS